MSDEQTIRSRAEALLAELTTAEKAGQLTQYFYFGFEREISFGGEAGAGSGSPSEAVEAALARGEVGSLLFVTDPAEINRLQKLAVEGQPARHPGAVRLRRHPRPAHDPAGADRARRLVGPRA